MRSLASERKPVDLPEAHDDEEGPGMLSRGEVRNNLETTFQTSHTAAMDRRMPARCILEKKDHWKIRTRGEE